MGGGLGRHPPVAVHGVVVASDIACRVVTAGIGVVGRDVPGKLGCTNRGMEAQVLRCIVDSAACPEEPHTLQVERHIHLVAGVGVETVEPHLVERRVHPLHPHLVDQDIGLYLIVIAAVDHQFVLLVEETDGAQRLRVVEVTYGAGLEGEGHERHNYNDCNTFHRSCVVWLFTISCCKDTKTFHSGKIFRCGDALLRL